MTSVQPGVRFDGNWGWSKLVLLWPSVSATHSPWHHHHSVFVHSPGPVNSSKEKLGVLLYDFFSWVSSGFLCYFMNTSAGTEEEMGTCNQGAHTVLSSCGRAPRYQRWRNFISNQPVLHSIKQFKFIHINNSCTYYAAHSECGTHINLSLSHSNRSASVIIPVLLGEDDTKGEILVH